MSRTIRRKNYFAAKYFIPSIQDIEECTWYRRGCYKDASPKRIQAVKTARIHNDHYAKSWRKTMPHYINKVIRSKYKMSLVEELNNKELEEVYVKHPRNARSEMWFFN